MKRRSFSHTLGLSNGCAVQALLSLSFIAVPPRGIAMNLLSGFFSSLNVICYTSDSRTGSASFRISSRRDIMEDQGANMLRRMFCGSRPLVLSLVIVSGFAAPAQPQSPSNAAGASPDISGMFTFLREGEFVQLSLEDGQLTGFVSRFGDTEDDKGTFIDQFFDKASVQGDHVTFKTKTIHAVWYEFDGTVTTVAGKQKGEEGYRVLKGKLTLHKADALGKDQASERTVEFQAFPDAEHMRSR